MAIVQVSRITHRRGLFENIPQLASAELGWCIDTRQLFIGNGTLSEGAPVVGNTELLTEFSDIPSLSYYTYKDNAAGYVAVTGPSPSEPIVRTVQERLDDSVSVRSYGAIGDGITDDTDAINRALFDIYCKNPADSRTRRTLTFPAGIYKISDTLIIPSHATLTGDGIEATVIELSSDSSSEFVARLADSSGEYGPNMGAGTMPTDIVISGMTFKSNAVVDIFVIENALRCSFKNVSFTGPLSETDLVPDVDIGYTPPEIAGIRILSITGHICTQIMFESCLFTGLKYGIETSSSANSVTVKDSLFNTLYSGIRLGVTLPVQSGGPTGFRAVGNMFDRIYSTGIHYGRVSQNITAHNMFYDVGNRFTGTPVDPVILFGSDNNISLSDLFSRTDYEDTVVPRVRIESSPNNNTTQIQLGHLTQRAGKQFVLSDGQSAQTIFTVNTAEVKSFTIEYNIVRNNLIRSGTLKVTSKLVGFGNDTISYIDEYTENSDVGVELIAEQVADNLVAIKYSSFFYGFSGTLTYSLRHL